MKRQQASVVLSPGKLLCDGANGSVDVCAECKELG
jgi:hypothetical protein